MSATRVVGLLILLASLPPAAASADWLITPFIGLKFAAATEFLDLDGGAGETKVTVGGSVALLGDGLLGVEGDFGYSPRFFERGCSSCVDEGGSSVKTLTGNVLVALPRTISRESLRPYVLGGLGLMQVRIDDVIGVFPIDSNLLCLAVGGGAIGDFSERTSLRLDLRHFRNVSYDDEAAGNGSRLSFWRATVGVSLRY